MNLQASILSRFLENLQSWKKFFIRWGKPFNEAINAGDREKALALIEAMAASDGTGIHWKNMVLKFMDHFGELPVQINSMMMLSESDESLKEYIRRIEKEPIQIP